ncbi:MAG: HAMP domain-containing histidine kinase [Arcobacteraceae bacterium]|nr:HAMP domain-containing histidine kinase [Arcobacteraceae bacterium]
MNKKLYLQLLLYPPIILIIISSTLITSYHIYQHIQKEQKHIQNVVDKYIKYEKNRIYKKVYYIVAKAKMYQRLIEDKEEHFSTSIQKRSKYIKDMLFKEIAMMEKENDSDLFINQVYNINGGKNCAKSLFSKYDPKKVGTFLSTNDKNNIHKQKVLNALKENGEFFYKYDYYKYNSLKPQTKYTYFYYYKPWDIMIGSGFFMDKLNKQIKDIKLKGKQNIKTEIVNAISFNAIVLLLIIFISYFISTKISKILKKNEDEINCLNNSLNDKVQEQIEEIRSKDMLLAQKSKAQSLGEISSMIAHQWRQPLSAINSVTAILYKDSKLDKLDNTKVQQNIEEIENLTQYMSQTITDFSNFYKPSKTKEYFDINKTVQSALDILFPKYYKDIKPKIIFIHTDEIMLYGYKSQIQQVILSILNNSIENFKLKNIKEPILSIDITKENSSVKIHIGDNGGGIEEENIDKIFDLYYTTKDDSTSSGMGLYIAKMMSKSCYNGDVKVKNTNKGAIFTLSCDIDEEI